MHPDDPRLRPADPLAMFPRRRPEDLPTPAMTRSARRMGGVDQASVAIALTGMSMYWLMPALMARRRPRRRASRQRLNRQAGAGSQ